jgi:hypothetical protein
MRRSVVIITCLLLGAVLLWLYFDTRLPPGVEAKGDTDSWLPWISLAGAFVSLLTGVATLALKLLELRAKLLAVRTRAH